MKDLLDWKTIRRGHIKLSSGALNGRFYLLPVQVICNLNQSHGLLRKQFEKEGGQLGLEDRFPSFCLHYLMLTFSPFSPFPWPHTGRQDDDGGGANIRHLLATLSHLLYRHVLRTGTD